MPQSILNNPAQVQQRASVSAGATTPAFVSVFEHTSADGLMGVGTVKNTGGVNNMNVRERVTDAFGVTDTETTIVLPGGDLLLDAQRNVGTARPPHISYEVEVQQIVGSTTFDLEFMSLGEL